MDARVKGRFGVVVVWVVAVVLGPGGRRDGNDDSSL
jgi:hypothetical protein